MSEILMAENNEIAMAEGLTWVGAGAEVAESR